MRHPFERPIVEMALNANGPPPLHIAALGPLKISYDSQSLAAQLPLKGQALLIYLALAEQPASRTVLAGLLWPDMPDDTARTNLRLTLSRLRQRLPPETLLATRQTAVFNRSRPHYVDAIHLEQLSGRLHAVDEAPLQQALQAVRGEFLQDFDLADAPAFEHWVLHKRQHYRRLVLDAYAHLLHRAQERGDYASSIELARNMLALEPWHEEGHRQLMWLLAVSGQRSAALAQFEICRRLLREELDVDPGAETVTLYEQIRAEQLALLPSSSFLTTTSSPAPSTRAALPPSLTPFIGRQVELALLQDRLLDPAYRLLTIAGPGGVGKTRLALVLAERCRNHFGDGLVYIPLAGIAERETVEQAQSQERLALAVGAALGLNFATSQDPWTQIQNYLRHKNCLLLLDNFETLQPAAMGLLDILQAASQVKLLVTSRLPLNLQAEYLFRLQGLKVPDEANVTPALTREVAAFDSLLLFQERAERAAGRSLSLAQDLPTVVQICRAVQGLPLGIELAASWLRWHTLEEIAEALDVGFDMPDGIAATTYKDLDPRHRSLRTVFAHSWRLLAPGERRVLAKLSYFLGPFSAEAARSAAECGRAELAALVDSSLLQHSLDGMYELHALLRHFAAEKLAEMDLDAARLARRHMTHYMDFVGQLAPALNGEEPLAALQRLHAEGDNVRLSWQLAASSPHVEALGRGLQGMVDAWTAVGLYGEGQEALSQALQRVQALGNSAAPELLARLREAYAGMLFEIGRYQEAEQEAQRALVLAREYALPRVMAAAYLGMGRALWGQGRFESAREAFEQALQMAREVEDLSLEAVTLRNLAAVFWRGNDLSQARTHCQEAQAINRRLGNVRNESKDNLLLGIIADNERRYDEAHAIFEHVLQLGQQSGDRRVVMAAYAEIGLTASHQGRLDRALHYLQRNLAMVRETGSLWHEGVTISNLGDLRLKLGDFAGAEAAYRDALEMARRAGAPVLEANVLSFWSLLDAFRGQHAQGIERARRALELAGQTKVPRDLAFALQFLAHNLLAARALDEAHDCYEVARSTWESLQEDSRALESLAGVACVALARDDASTALEHAGALFAKLSGGELVAADDPSGVFLTCYDIFDRAGDPRAHKVLLLGWRELQERAARIGDATLRRAFLENVPSNARLRHLASSGAERSLSL